MDKGNLHYINIGLITRLGTSYYYIYQSEYHGFLHEITKKLNL